MQVSHQFQDWQAFNGWKLCFKQVSTKLQAIPFLWNEEQTIHAAKAEEVVEKLQHDVVGLALRSLK